MSDYKKLQQQRDKKAEEMGEGSWLKKGTSDWFSVEATFYPTPKLWIIEGENRREITRKELEKDYAQLEL